MYNEKWINNANWLGFLGIYIKVLDIYFISQWNDDENKNFCTFDLL